VERTRLKQASLCAHSLGEGRMSRTLIDVFWTSSFWEKWGKVPPPPMYGSWLITRCFVKNANFISVAKMDIKDKLNIIIAYRIPDSNLALTDVGAHVLARHKVPRWDVLWRSVANRQDIGKMVALEWSPTVSQRKPALIIMTYMRRDPLRSPIEHSWFSAASL